MKKILLLIALFCAITSIKALAGDGSVDNPYTVSEARALAKSSDKVWVQGYIVGGRYDDFDQPWDNDFAVSIAESPSETSIDNCIQIKLESASGHRALYGLSSNPGVYGKQIKAYGFRDDYGGASFPSIEGITSADNIIEITGGNTGGETVVAPTFNPAAGTYTSVQNVEISTTTAGATIYYTTDGSAPDKNSTLYSTPVIIAETTTLKAIAYNAETASTVATAIYKLEISSQDALIPYVQNFTSNQGNFTTESVVGDQVWAWGTFDGGCMVMSGYASGDNNNTDWLISPTFDFSQYTNLKLTFREAINYMTSYNDLQVMVSTNYNGDAATPANWTALSVTGRSTGDNWNFVDVDSIDLKAYEGKSAVTIAFKYTSSTAGSSSWEISKVSITGTKAAIAEPSNHVTNFSATTGTITATSIELAWNENDGAVVPTGYLIKASTNDLIAPTDKVDLANDTNLTDGTGNVKVLHGTTTYTFSNCSPGTTYNFGIYPYTGQDSTIQYKTESAPTTQATTLSLATVNPSAFEAEVVSTSQINLSWKKNANNQPVIVATNLYSEVEGKPADGSTYSVNDTLSGGGTVIYVGSEEAFQAKNLETSTYYYYKIWSVSDAGVYSDGLSANAATLTPEPSNHVENFRVDTVGLNNIALKWNNINGGTQPDGYLLTINNIAINLIAPTDGTEISGDTDISDGTGAVIVSNEMEGYIWNGLNSNTTYIVSIYPYTNSGKFIDFKTDSVPTVMATSLSGVSTPVFSPVAGTYSDSVEVSISCATEGATIYYNPRGLVSGIPYNEYTGPFYVYESTTIAAYAKLDSMSSEAVEVSYVINITPIEVATPVISPANGEFTDSVEVSISCTTPDAMIYYTTDGTTPTNASMLYSSSFVITENTTVKAIAYVNEYSGTVAEASYVIKETVAPIEVNTLAELRAGQTDGTIYHFNGEAVVTFVQSYRGQKYIQDETAAILIDDNAGIITSEFKIGDGISDLAGTLYDYNGLLEFVPTMNTSPFSPTIKIVAQRISIAEFKSNFENYESELISFEKVKFGAPSLFEAGTNYVISDGTENTVLRSHFYDVDYIGSTMIDGSFSVTGIALWNSNEAKIVPRMNIDMQELTSVNDLSSSILIFSKEHSIYINKPASNCKVEVYSVDGRKEKSMNAEASNVTINMEKTGLFMVVVKSEQQIVKVQKVMIQ